MFDGDDISQSDISVAILDLIIAAGERRIYREVRSSTQVTALTGTTSGNLLALPSDFLELKLGPYVGTFTTATYMPLESINNAIQIGVEKNENHPFFFSFQGDNLIFYPTIPDATAISGQYYKKFADISGGTLNALFTRHPDVFLYAALAESAPFLGEMTRLPIWEGKYVSLAKAANEEETRRVTRGGKLQTRVDGLTQWNI